MSNEERDKLELEIVKMKGDVNLVTMAIGKIDDNLSSLSSSQNKALEMIQNILLTLTKYENMEHRISHLEDKLDGIPTKESVSKLEEDVSEIKDIPNKVLMRFILVAVGALALSVASNGGIGG